jgi:NTE family protein
MIGVPLPQIQKGRATSPIPDEYWPPLPLIPAGLADKFIGRWINLLDTGPLLQTLQDKFSLDEDKMKGCQQTFLITATNVQTGERVIFSNKPIYRRDTGEQRNDVIPGITLNRIIASCSIPLVYPWTEDKDTGAFYWDGAVVANTPLGAALDAVSDHPIEIPMEVMVVLMTPWWESGGLPPERARNLPESFGDAITWTLDWALLASFRERLRLIEAYNRFTCHDEEAGKPQRYRKVRVVIISPEDFFEVQRIIDYDEYSEELINFGYEAAKKAFKENFAA